MAYEVTMPRLGWTMEEGVFGEWLKQDGDEVKAGDLLFTVEGDKATQEVEVFEGGILRLPANAPASGDVIPVGALLAYIVQAGESLPEESGHAARQVAQTDGAGRRCASVSDGAGCCTECFVVAASCRGRTRHANYQPAGAARGGRVGGRLGAVKRQRPHGTDRRTGRARRRGDRRIRDGRGRHAGSASLCGGGRY